MRETAKKKRGILKVIGAIIVVYLILTLTKCTVTREKYVTREVPSTVTEIKENPIKNCGDAEYEYEYSWEGWEPEVNNTIATRFKLTNLENKKGVFTVRFAFFDEAEHPFGAFQGVNYDEVKNVLPWSSASMWSNITQEIEGRSSAMFVPSVKKKNSTSTYWAYAIVEPPKREKCVTKYNYTKINKTIMVNRTVRVNKTETISLLDLIIGS